MRPGVWAAVGTATLVAALGCASDDEDRAAPPTMTPEPDAMTSNDAIAPGDDAGADAKDAEPRLDFGVSFSPLGFGGRADVWLANRAAFYEARRDYGSVVAYHFNWRDEPAPRPPCGTSPQILELIDGDVKAHSFTLSIVLGWSTGAGAPDLDCGGDGSTTNNTWQNAEARAQFKAVAVQIASRLRPAYLFLGNEVNTWYLKHPSDGSGWMSEVADVANAVRAASPTTLVGTTYQWEHLRGGGRNNGWSDPPQWQLVDAVAGIVDVLGITTYPYFDYASPALVPADHYAELARFPGPIAVTETAWRESSSAPYPGSPLDQMSWPGALVGRLAPPRLRYAAWLFFNEALGDLGPFATTGLRDTTGKPRSVDSSFRELVKERQRP